MIPSVTIEKSEGLKAPRERVRRHPVISDKPREYHLRHRAAYTITDVGLRHQRRGRFAASANVSKQAGFYSDFDPGSGTWPTPGMVSSTEFGKLRVITDDYAGHTDSGSDTGATSTYVRASVHEVATALAALTGEPHPLATPDWE